MKKRAFVLILSLLLNSCMLNAHHAISYKLNGGRLGDCIYSFCLAKWLAYKYETKFYYVPFEHADAFSLGLYEEQLTQTIEKTFKKTVLIRTEEALAYQLKKTKKKTLFYIDFLATIDAPQDIKEADPLMENIVATNWLFLFMKQHQAFDAEIKRDLEFRQRPQDITLPDGMISVAVHVRKGGGFDRPLTSCQYAHDQKSECIRECQLSTDAIDRILPLKFPPEQYYVDQIIKVSDMLNNQPIFACIFTDDPEPERLIERFKQRINRPNILFASAHNGHNVFQHNVLDDVYQMSRFDCLIKTDSHFAWIAQLIGAHKICVYPQWSEWDAVNSMNIITKVGVLFNKGPLKDIVYMPFIILTQEHKKVAAHCCSA